MPAGTCCLDGVEEADELLMAVALHVAADDRAVEHVERGEQRRRAVPLVVVGHGAGAALLHRQAGLGAVERLDLALLVDREHDGVRRRIDVEPDDVAQLVGEVRVVGELEAGARGAAAGRAPRQMRCTELTLMPAALAIARAGPVGRLARRLGQRQRHHPLDHRLRRAAGCAAAGSCRAAGRRRPPAANRSCQRQTQVLRLAGPAHDRDRAEPVGGQQDDPARQTCFCGLLRSATIRSRRRRSTALMAMVTPLRMPRTRTAQTKREFPLWIQSSVS